MVGNFDHRHKMSTLELLKIQRQVLFALMLRDIKTRFFGSSWGFLIALAWPLTHIIILLMINTTTGRLPPFGDSSALWFSTGIVPFMAFSYMSRFIMYGIVLNRPLLVFPYVKIMDILMARAIIEILSAGCVVVILIGMALYFDVQFIPARPTEAFYALGAAFLLGLGLGVINAIVAQALPIWATGYSLIIIVFWIVSGVFFVPENMPETIRYALSFNPILQDILWFRSAYYDGYGGAMLDKWYIINYGSICLFVGLALERLVRGRLLQG